MSILFIDTIVGFLIDPISTFQKQKETSFVTASLYFILLFVIYSVLGGIVSMLFMNRISSPLIAASGNHITGSNFSSSLIILTIILMFIFIIVGAFILHLFNIIVGGKKGVKNTLKVVFYSSIPFFLLGWIPFVSYIFMLWSIALGIIGIHELQELSVGKSIFAIIAACAITYILLGAVITGILFSTFNLVHA